MNRESILVCYKKNLINLVDQNYWNTSVYLPWPRHDPLPGTLGVQRRLSQNLQLIDRLVINCDSLFIHSAVYDSEVINYFINFFKVKLGAKNFCARIIPDGIISTRKHPVSLINRILKKTRNFRQLLNRNLVYTHIKGDRIGSDAEFIDLIYVIDGFPHEYIKAKTKILPPLFDRNCESFEKKITENALVIGQPLKGFRIMSDLNIQLTTDCIFKWLNSKKIVNVFYKRHPKDKVNTLSHKNYTELKIDIPLEIHLSKIHYDYVISVNSTGLLTAKQIYLDSSKVISFAINQVNFKNESEKNITVNLFNKLNIQMKKI